jgi:hypothetical protein
MTYYFDGNSISWMDVWQSVVMLFTTFSMIIIIVVIVLLLLLQLG